jgi:subtilisin family serine protease
LFLTSILIIFLFQNINAQNTPPDNWFNSTPEVSNVTGIKMDKAYHDLLHGVKGKPVIVAIIDSGVESDHEDLKSRMWNNR